MEFKDNKNINVGRLFFGAVGSTVNDVTNAFDEVFLRIPQITPSVHVEPQLLKQITSDKQAKAAVMDKKIFKKSLN